MAGGPSLWSLAKFGAALYLANETVRFFKDMVHGTAFQTGSGPSAERIAGAANAGNRPLPQGVQTTQNTSRDIPVDPNVRANLATVAGRDAIKASQSLDTAINGQTEASRLVYQDGHGPVMGSPREALERHKESLRGNANSDMVRVTLPGSQGRTLDFDVPGAVNDRAAMASMQEAYAAKARREGLPSELPSGASIIVGSKADRSELLVPSQPREYRFVEGDRFQRNPSFAGSIDAPGNSSFAEASGFRDGSRRFDLSEIRQGDPNLIRSADLERQAGEASLIIHREPYLGATSRAVTSPVSMMDGLLGRQGGSGFSDLAGSVGVQGHTMLVQSVDLENGRRGVGVVSPVGSAVMGTGPDGDFVSASRRDPDGLLMHVQASGMKGELGQFASDGHFAGTDKASTVLSNVSNALGHRRDSPVLSAAQSSGVQGEKDVLVDLTAGKEAVSTRLHFGSRIVDYTAREGQMTMLERDPVSGAVQSAAMIRSRDIHVNAEGHVGMDAKSRDLVSEHVRLYASGRSGTEFAQAHPVEATQFASLRDNLPLADRSVAAVSPAVPDVETTASAHAIRQAGAQRSQQVPVFDDLTPPRQPAVMSRGLGD